MERGRIAILLPLIIAIAQPLQAAQGRTKVRISPQPDRDDKPVAPARAAGDWSPDFGELKAIAARHGVPAPPNDARQVLAYTRSWLILGEESTSRDPRVYAPAFLLEQKDDGSIVILRGLERLTLGGLRAGEPAVRPFSVEPVEPKLGGYAVEFGTFSTFICAVQSAARGDDVTARTIWRRFEERWSEGREVPEGGRARQAEVTLLLGQCLFDDLAQQLVKPDADWHAIEPRMGAILGEFPALKEGDRIEVYDGLTDALTAKPPGPDSVEGRLLDWSRRPSTMRHLGLFHEGEGSEADAPAREIVLRGLDAVEDLARLLKDRRITSHLTAGINVPQRIAYLGELAGRLLREITGSEGPIEDFSADLAKTRAWVAEQRAAGEANYFARVLFRRKGVKITGVNEIPARILAHKFPERLPALCEEFSKHATPEAEPFALAKVLAKSRLPKEVRIDALASFAQRGSLAHRRCVLQCLVPLDARRCAQLLGPLLEDLPRDTKGPYWRSPEANLAHVVLEIEEDGIWRSYLRAARRSSVGLRMQLMEPMNYAYVEGKNRQRRLAFLAAFLGDETSREIARVPDKFDGPCAAFTFTQIEVRDLAALKIASILCLDEGPDETWTPDRWAGLRAKVRVRLSGERLPELEEK